MLPEDRKVLASFSLVADTAEFRRASAWVEQVGRSNGIPAEQINRLDICINEALANIVEHGGEGALRSRIDIRLEIGQLSSGDQTASLTLIDGGRPFNSVTHVTRPAPTRLEEATRGGLGIQMIRTYADELAYEFLDDHNHLSFAVRWPQPTSMP